MQVNQRRVSPSAVGLGGVAIHSSWHELEGSIVAIGDITVWVGEDVAKHLGAPAMTYVTSKITHDTFNPIEIRLMSDGTREDLATAVALVDRAA